MKIDLSQQHILVTGASRGIGAAIAKQLYDAGATLSLTYHNNKAQANSLTQSWDPHRYRWYAVDFVQPQSAAQLVTASIAQLGPLHGVVNNAAIALSLPPDLAHQPWMDGWQSTLQVNLNSVAAITHALLPHFVRQGSGRFVNISSRAAFRGDTPNYMAYAASKGGMVALTRSVARGYGKQGICAFVIAPGFTQTEMAQPFIDQYGPGFVTDDLALPAITQPTDISPTVAFLLSGLADHATGTTIDINAGSYVH